MNENQIAEIIPEPIKTEVVPRNISYARSLRLLADFYEQHEKMFIPELQMKIYDTQTREDLMICAKALGSFKKVYSDNFIYLDKTFGDITLRVAEYRSKTCERVVTGTKKVLKEIPITTQTVEVEEEIVEWKCKESSLLGRVNEPVQIEESII